ncbi:MAG: EAL domain-containing protein [Gammaproteobacteria bacterium]|uniref:GGDEF/EAL domain-containing response regulator n=1 Tax=Pseudomaricurvus alcaniphilus TaxID=1166482 RepID=UPI00140AA457|nr:EAL domain-containing response regulator [Pseudomaricurvus alcaniphilus]MBR9909147.1 EAL domain-containing protein [Gammaproteobacteria bacterium]NHN39942.1 EAL domain-containing protein [Pseudomaricurvus alcaniphilus]
MTVTASNTSSVHKLHSDLKSSLIMMVDDEPIMMELVQAFLEGEGYSKFLTLEDSTIALQTMKERRPDVLLLDLNMPVVDGFDILRSLRASAEFSRLPIIVLTANSDSASKLKALELGATDFLAKPVDPSELALRLQNTLSMKTYHEQLIYFDALTGLPNRRMFVDRLKWVLERGKQTEATVVLVNINLDNFKKINQSMGMLAGDAVLQQFSESLLAQVHNQSLIESDDDSDIRFSLYRLGSAEFTLLLPAIEDATTIKRSIHAVNTALAKPVVVGQHVFKMTASTGIAISAAGEVEADDLIGRATDATLVASESGGNCVRLFSEEIRALSKQRMELEIDLRNAVANGQMRLYYQPKVAADTLVVIGMEALLRWHHPTRGVVSPGVFIPLAEELDLMPSLGEWVIFEACRQLAEWSSRGMQDVKLAINVSQQQLGDERIIESLSRALDKYEVSPSSLVIEITESLAMGDSDFILDLLNQIRELGIRLSIDDFGTGYSSLSHLAQLPIHELKIDQSFLLGPQDTLKMTVIIKTIIAMAHSMNLTVVAEGVETAEHLELLRRERCDIIQGFYFSKPLPADEFFKYFNGWGSHDIQLDL